MKDQAEQMQNQLSILTAAATSEKQQVSKTNHFFIYKVIRQQFEDILLVKLTMNQLLLNWYWKIIINFFCM